MQITKIISFVFRSIICLFFSLSLKSQVCFSPAKYIHLPNRTAGLTSGYFNNDTQLDLAVTLNYDDKLAVFFGNGNGTFNSPSIYNTYAGVNYVTKGDFNGDGKIDIAVPDAYVARVFYGNGLGLYSPTATLHQSPGFFSQGIASADFNGDNNDDLVIANDQTNNVSILLGTNGLHNAAFTVPVGMNPRTIAIGDFNNDRKLDIIAANSGTNSLTILFGNGTDGFPNSATYTTSIYPGAIALSDFNNDGSVDIATTNSGVNSFSNVVSVLLNNGNGVFNSATSYLVGKNVSSVTSGDYNGDGNKDLAVSRSVSDTVSILIGNGLGVFSKPKDVHVTLAPRYIITGDFNGDGLDDIAGSGSFNPVILLNITPTISIISKPNIICSGQSAILTAHGSNVYFWNNGATGSYIIVYPNKSTSYSVTSTVNGCKTSAVLTLKVSCTDLESKDLGIEILKIFPNPCSYNFTIESHKSGNLSVFNEFGEKIREISLTENTIFEVDILDLPTGLYFLNGTLGEVQIHRKLIVNH